MDNVACSRSCHMDATWEAKSMVRAKELLGRAAQHGSSEPCAGIRGGRAGFKSCLWDLPVVT